MLLRALSLKDQRFPSIRNSDFGEPALARLARVFLLPLM
jgi:hypothetical protein